jgi:hypothetical protein
MKEIDKKIVEYLVRATEITHKVFNGNYQDLQVEIAKMIQAEEHFEGYSNG